MGCHEYWIHRYEGALNGIDKAVVLLFYPKNAFGNRHALRVFICSALNPSEEKILSHYTHHWNIEVMFKQQKMYMGLRALMVRSAKAIDRLFIILPLAHFFFAVLYDTLLPLSAAIRSFSPLCALFDFAHLECLYSDIGELGELSYTNILLHPVGAVAFHLLGDMPVFV